MFKHFTAVAVLALFVSTTSAGEFASAKWPRWRGPDASGSTTTGKYPTGWADGKNIAWKIKLPGRGCSTPIVWGEQIILTTPIDGKDALISLDWKGKTRWQTVIGPQRRGKHRNGSGSNPSPVTDGTHLFAYYKSGRLVGLDMKGKLLWKTNLQERFAKDTLYWDLGTSPVLTDKHVVVAVMHKGESFLAAFDKKSGEMAWKTARNYECPTEGDHSYATPTVIQHKGQQAILTWGAEHVTVHRATDGKLLWSCGGFNPKGKEFWVAVSSSVVVDGMVVVPYGRGTHLCGVGLGGSGDVTETHRKWTRKDTGAFVPTPAAFGGKLYLLGDRGEISCVDPKTGKTLWSGALPKSGKKYYASPTVADGKLYAAREDGVIYVAQVVGGFKVLSKNVMKEQTIASPVAVAGHLLIRGATHLVCVKTP
jgi:outer membrane protein assembly factor BamB